MLSVAISSSRLLNKAQRGERVSRLDRPGAPRVCPAPATAGRLSVVPAGCGVAGAGPTPPAGGWTRRDRAEALPPVPDRRGLASPSRATPRTVADCFPSARPGVASFGIYS